MSHQTRPVRLDEGPANATYRLILAHGAGAGMTSPFLEHMCELIAARGIAVTRFEFAYMAARRDGGSRRPPPKAETLTAEYQRALSEVAADRPTAQRLVIGGKSLGGRVASMIADEAYKAGTISGLVCLGYPFHPPGKPDQLRTAHLETIGCPALFVQGARDPFGNASEVAQLTLSPAIKLHWADDGDHDLAPRRASGFTQKGNQSAAADAIAAFAAGLTAPRVD